MPKISDARRDEMRERLLDAAVRVMETKGPAAATTRAILAEAGLSAGAMYHYFGSKDEVFQAVAQRFIDLDPGMAVDLPDEPEALAAWHRAILDDLFTPGHHSILPQMRLASWSNDLVRQSLAHYDRGTVERAGALNRKSQEVGLFRDDVDAEALVEVMATFFEGFVLRDQVGAFVTGRERVLRQLYALLDAGVVADHPAAADLFTEPATSPEPVP